MGLVANLGQWIDAKFPDKVVVTDSAYRALLARTQSLEKEIDAQDTRIKNLCKELVELKMDEVRTDLNKLKMAAGFRSLGQQFPQMPGIVPNAASL